MEELSPVLELRSTPARHPNDFRVLEWVRTWLLVREALDTHRQFDSTVYSEIGYLHTMLGTVLLARSRPSDAEAALRESLENFAKSLPSDHQYVASAEHYLGEAVFAQGHLSDAEALFTAAANRWNRTGAPEWRAARSNSALGEVL